jgi:hypothetical protein
LVSFTSLPSRISWLSTWAPLSASQDNFAGTLSFCYTHPTKSQLWNSTLFSPLLHLNN